MNTIETSHDPAEQVAIAREQGATAREPVLPANDGDGLGGRSRWLMGANIAVGMALGALMMLLLRRRR